MVLIATQVAANLSEKEPIDLLFAFELCSKGASSDSNSLALLDLYLLLIVHSFLIELVFFKI